jgi:proline iminopeptidase
VFYRIVGEGPPAVYVHPFQNPTTRVAEIIPYRTRLSFVLPHPRGMLRSSPARTADELGLDRLVEDLEELRRHLGIDRWVLHGRSEGGFVSLLYATRYPEAVAGLVLFATAPSYRYLVRQQGLFEPDHPGFALLNATLWRALAEPTDHNYSAHWTARARILMRARAIARNKPLPDPPQAWPDVGDLPKHRKSEDIPLGAAVRFQRFMLEILAYDVREALKAVQAPALVLVGRYDPYTTPDQSEELAAALPQAELVVLEHAAHALSIDAGPEVEKAVHDFLTRHRLGRAPL